MEREDSERGTEQEQPRVWQRPNHAAVHVKEEEDDKLGFGKKQHLIMISVAVGLLVLLVVITVPAVLLTESDSSSLQSFPTDGDMLEFLVQSGEISTPDGLLATWYHRANKKEEMDKALLSDVMILEADVTLEGYGTPSQKPIPIMAHPPDIYSDNTLDQWLDAVLSSRKGIKLDFKNLASVGLSLDVLSQKNATRGINRPVWINADILIGPNTPSFMPVVNGTGFLQVVQEKFPDVTLSPGWMVSYAPPIFTDTYTNTMVQDMYDMIKDVPQRVTFPIHALLARTGWQHISWLLSQTPQSTLTLWQGSIHPNISDLLFIRDNTHPARVYYDIYEPTLSQFKELAGQPRRLRRFYPGGDLMDFLYHTQRSHTNPPSAVPQNNILEVHWFTVTDQASLLAKLSDGAGGMLVVRVGSDPSRPGVPVVEGSRKGSELFTLQDVLQLLEQSPEAPWGVYLRVQSQQLLEASLQLLHSAYNREELYRPVWISMEGLQTADNTNRFVSTVEELFPYITFVLTEQSWPPLVPLTVSGLSQRVALHLSAVSLPKRGQEHHSLVEMMERYDIIVEEDLRGVAEALTRLKVLTGRKERANTKLYVISNQS
ncbi:protein FAM151A [Scomber japonicus]|uniref:protein FAM151A n=1 Tax=Scomber japonicus TaxID=13676 RepID=UPI002306349C|nr:protein FAM151A [Scomber japonicus]